MREHLMHPSASSLVTGGMAVVALSVALALVLGWTRTFRAPGAARSSSAVRAALAVAVWLLLFAALGFSGVLRRYDVQPPPLMPSVVAALALSAALACSSIGARFARLPLPALVGFQAFRFPLELVMHRAAVEGTMPMQMSFSGWNFDVVTGASAVLVAVLVARGAAPRWLVLAWAVLGTVLLVAIVAIAVASTPLFAAFGPDRLNTWIGWFPFVWLPSVLVPAALFGQIVVFRRLHRDARKA